MPLFVNWSETDKGDDRGGSVGCLCIGPHEGDAVDSIAWGETIHDDGPSEEQEKLFALLAAAPDLLAACELWDQGFVEGEEFDAAQFLAWVNKNRRAARAAIAKAKGN